MSATLASSLAFVASQWGRLFDDAERALIDRLTGASPPDSLDDDELALLYRIKSKLLEIKAAFDRRALS
jgi:hypothetical protein